MLQCSGRRSHVCPRTLVNWYGHLLHVLLKDGKNTPTEVYVREQALEGITEKEMKGDLHVKI